MNRAVVLLSGGMDSLVTASIAANENDYICFLHANYGQRTEDKELSSYEKLIKHYKPEKSLVINMDWFSKIGGSALTDISIEIKEHAADNKVPLTYVPFRNANLISAAVAWAEVIKANRVYIGAVEEDSSGYPDCRSVFFSNMQLAINTGIKQTETIEIITPVIHLKKSEIVALGFKLKSPFEFSWSCYKNNDLACGVCDSCYLRIKAFKEAGLTDPITYAEGI